MGDTPAEARPETKRAIRRTRTGCQTCRFRKVKCDENKPECTQCQKGRRSCEWPAHDSQKARRHRSPRRPNATACDACRFKKLKCVGATEDSCQNCKTLGVVCERTRRRPGVALVDNANDSIAMASQPLQVRATGEAFSQAPRQGFESSSSHVPTASTPSSELPTGKELECLVQLYFASVHHFGFFSFIHPLQFNRLLARGKAPRPLTLIMIANAVRFASTPTPDNLARADAWADAAIEAVVPRVYQGFGAVQLMILLLAQHYDFNRGNFTSAWLLGASCTRMMQMMSLQTFDRTYPAGLSSHSMLSPILSSEALRRVAWSVFYTDTIIDGGRYGFHTVDVNSYRLQLPCDQASFLGDEAVVTEPLHPNTRDLINSALNTSPQAERAPLDMWAYLLRTADARRRALHFAFRASHKEQTTEVLSSELVTLEADMKQVVSVLPKRFHFNADNMILHRDRLITFIFLHILRHNLFIIIGRAALHVYLHDPTKSDLVPQVRRNRISHALPIASLVGEGLKARITFDPQTGVQAYVALEILLFEPRRLAEVDPSVDPKATEFMQALSHLLAVTREIGARSEFVHQLHIEAVLRLLRCDCSQLLDQVDHAAFRSEYRLVGQDAAEYDFRDFRWAKLERIRRRHKKPPNVNMERDEALLEYEVDGETAATSTSPSPRLDAIHVSEAVNAQPAATQQPSGVALGEFSTSDTSQFWWGPSGHDESNQGFSLDWSWWLLDFPGASEDLIGNPLTF